MSVQLESTRVDGWEAVVLANDAMRVVILPELGGKIVSLQSRASGREWLWRNPFVSLRRAPANVSRYGPFDSGGWDEVFPTVDPCCVPNSAWGTRPLTDHGDLWYRPWQVVESDCQPNETAKLSMCVDDPALPFYFERTLTLSAGQSPLSIKYELRNRSTAPMPYIWAAHPLMAIEPGDSIRLPAGTQMNPTVSVGVELASDSNAFEWPLASLVDDRRLDFSQIPAVGAGYAIKLFAEKLPDGLIEVNHANSGERIQFVFDVAQIAHVGLWLNYSGWSGDGIEPYFNAGIEPTSASGDNLDYVAQRGRARSSSWKDSPLGTGSEDRFGRKKITVILRLPERYCRRLR